MRPSPFPLRLLGLFATLGAVLGCSEPDPNEVNCDELCDMLVTDCAYAAFPDQSSCIQGCLYNASVGGDIEGELDCVFLAQCDTFAIVECEHQYGPTGK